MILSTKPARSSRRRQRSHAIARRAESRRRMAAEMLESRTLLAGDLMHNVDLPTDVNADGYTSPVDALYVINELNANGSRSLTADEAARESGLFYDVNNDQYITPMDAVLILNDLNGEGEGDDLVQIRLQATDLSGNAIDTIDVGQDYQLRAFVQDLTAREDGGVFAAYVDIDYNPALTSVDGIITYAIEYRNGRRGDVTTPGLMEHVGAFASFTDPYGPDEFLLFTVPMSADAAGSVTFVPDGADPTVPFYDVLLFNVPEGEESGFVPTDRISFISDTIQIGSVLTPQAVDDSYDAVEGNALIVGADLGVLANDINPGTAALVASLQDGPDNGQLILSPNGSFSYTPDSGFFGPDAFTYVALLNDVPSNLATVTIDVARENTAPVAVDNAYSTNEDQSLTVPAVGVLSNDSDADGDPLTAMLVSEPANGSVTLNSNGSFTYTPDSNFNGTDTFEYVANDGLADSNVATVTITVDAVNDPPVAADDDYSVSVNTTLTVNAAEGVLSNDTDPEGNGLTAQLLSSTTHGVVELAANGSFVYTPTTDFVGQDTFTYAAFDGAATSSAATVTITVGSEIQVRFRLETTNLFGDPITSIGPGGDFLLNTYVQDVSMLGDGVFAAYLDVLYDSSLVTINGTIDFGESYPNSQTANTAIPGVINEAGAFDGTTPLGKDEFLLFSVPMSADDEGMAVFSGAPAADSPAYQVLLFDTEDAVPVDQIDYGTTQLQIIAGEAPVAVDDEYETDEDVTLIVNADDGVLANDTDEDSETLVAILASQPAHGIVVLDSDGSFTYEPDLNFFGVDSFTYRANDGAQNSNLATVTITVNPINDVPIAIDDFYQMENIGSLIVDAENGVLANDIDVDGQSLSAVLVTTTSNGVLSLNSDGSFEYTPDDDFIGRDTFTYRAEADDELSNIATVSIDVGDLTPSSIFGFVYSDTDNDGALDTGEARYGGVRITLRGLDLFGQAVSLETRTAANGLYSFDGVLRGNYVLTEFQPLGLVDGKDTIHGELSLRNDRFLIDLPAGEVVGDYNFGERGLMPEFIRDPYFFASRTSHGLLSMSDSDGEMAWYCLDDGWIGLASVDVQLAPNMSTADIVVVDIQGSAEAAQVRLNTSRDARLVGSGDSGYLMRLVGDPDDFGFSPISSDGALDGTAVDAVFGGDDV